MLKKESRIFAELLTLCNRDYITDGYPFAHFTAFLSKHGAKINSFLFISKYLAVKLVFINK